MSSTEIHRGRGRDRPGAELGYGTNLWTLYLFLWGSSTSASRPGIAGLVLLAKCHYSWDKASKASIFCALLVMPWPRTCSPLHVQTQTLPSDPTSRPSHVELFVPWTCAKGGWQGEKKICCFLLLFFVDALLQTWSWLYVWTMWFCSWKGFVTKSLGALSGWSTLQSFSFLDVLELLLMYLSFGELNIVQILIYVIEYLYIYTCLIHYPYDSYSCCQPKCLKQWPWSTSKKLGGNCDISCPKLVVYLVRSCCFLFISTIFRLVNCLGPHAWKWLAGGGRSACRHAKCRLDITALWMSLVIKIWMRCNRIHKLCYGSILQYSKRFDIPLREVA